MSTRTARFSRSSPSRGRRARSRTPPRSTTSTFTAGTNDLLRRGCLGGSRLTIAASRRAVGEFQEGTSLSPSPTESESLLAPPDSTGCLTEDIEAGLDAGVGLEQRLDWAGALRHYESVARELDAESLRGPDWDARKASLEMRRGNALMGLGRMDDARSAFDASPHAAKASPDRPLLARAPMGAGGVPGRTGDPPPRGRVPPQ